MGMSWDIVIIGIVCTCIGLLAGWGRYHGKVGLLRMEIKVLKRELSDERARGEAYGKAADEWRVASMHADAEVERLKRETALVQKALAHRILEDGDKPDGWSPDYWRQVPPLAWWYAIGFVSVGTWELGRWLGSVLWRLWS